MNLFCNKILLGWSGNHFCHCDLINVQRINSFRSQKKKTDSINYLFLSESEIVVPCFGNIKTEKGA
jgi:hypothetical protein